ncbi:MAG TPA: hypothetical protein GX505_02620 [Clostridiales bacterium]|nr:hypothetical protein [Clostridiales bacterium]
MSLSRNLIKNNQVDMAKGCLQIPLMPIRNTLNGEKKSAAEWEAEEKARQIQVKLENMIRQAEAQAESIIQQAREQAQAIQMQARDEGYQAGLQEGRKSGFQAGYKEGMQSTEQMQKQAKALLQAAHRESREYIRKTQAEIIKLAAAMAKKIIHINIDMNDESIVEMVREALHSSEDRKQVLLRSPAHYIPILQASSCQFEKICPNATFVFLEDSTLKEYDCIIETEDQVIHLEIDQQLDNIVNALMKLEI